MINGKPSQAQRRPDIGDSVLHHDLTVSKHSLEAVKVIGRRITASDIIDSVIRHSKYNYPVNPAMSAKLDISLATNQDTFFKISRLVYYVRPFSYMKDWFLLTQARSDSSNPSINKLSSNQSIRMLDVQGYPGISIDEYLNNLKRQIARNDAFYIHQADGQQNTFSIIVRFKSEPGSALTSVLAPKDIDSGYDKTASFTILTIARAGWAILYSYSVMIEINQENYETLHSAQTYGEASSIVLQLLENKSSKRSLSKTQFTKADAGAYRLQSFELNNDLFLVSRKVFRRTENSEHSVYRYYIHDVAAMDSQPAEKPLLLSIKALTKLKAD
jgi:hypothetical protein